MRRTHDKDISYWATVRHITQWIESYSIVIDLEGIREAKIININEGKNLRE